MFLLQAVQSVVGHMHLGSCSQTHSVSQQPVTVSKYLFQAVIILAEPKVLRLVSLTRYTIYSLKSANEFTIYNGIVL